MTQRVTVPFVTGRGMAIHDSGLVNRQHLGQSDAGANNNVLGEQGLQRNVALTVSHWLLVPSVLVPTDLITVMSERAAKRFVDSGTVMRPLPFPTDQFDWTMYWHRRYEHSRAHQWLREQVRAASKEVKKVTSPQSVDANVKLTQRGLRR